MLAAVLLPGMAGAAERRVSIGSFERIRVEGPFQVTVITGHSPGATVTGDPRQLDRVEVRADGGTLVIRNPLEKWTAAAATGAKPVTIAVGTTTLSTASVVGGGALTITGMKAPALNLAVTGAGSIAVTGADAEQARAAVVGNGSITLAGRAKAVRLSINGPGKIEADGLTADELIVRIDGPGEANTRARYLATVTNAGLGQVTVAGRPKCTVNSAAGGPVTCGVGQAH